MHQRCCDHFIKCRPEMTLEMLNQRYLANVCSCPDFALERLALCGNDNLLTHFKARNDKDMVKIEEIKNSAKKATSAPKV